MAIKTFTAGSVLTASDTNTYLANSGLVYVTQVTVGSGVTTVNITSCFNSTYDNYLISWANITATANSTVLQGKLLVGTTPNASNWTANTFFLASGGAGGFNNVAGTNQALTEVGSCDATYKLAGFFNLQSPNLATASYIQWSHMDNAYWRYNAAILRNSTQYDGIQILAGAGTLTGGVITVYGYRKA